MASGRITETTTSAVGDKQWSCAYVAKFGGAVPDGEDATEKNDQAGLQHVAEWLHHSEVG